MTCSPSPNRREKHRLRKEAYDKRRDILGTAYHDFRQGFEGEVIARMASDKLAVDVGEVLRDPKLRYRHPRV
jgi:hypothetical protein